MMTSFLRSRLRRTTGAAAAIVIGSIGLTAVPASAVTEDETTPATEIVEGDDAPASDPTPAPVPGVDAESSEDATLPEPVEEVTTEDAAPGVATEDSAPVEEATEEAIEANALPDEAVTINLLAISDFHGAIDQAAAIDFQIDAMRDANANSAFVAVGDSVGGSAYESSIANDEPTIDILNAMGLDATAVGNHEFDKGASDLAGRLVEGFDAPLLGANVSGIDLQDYHVMTFDEVKVAFIGTVTQETPRLVGAGGIEGVSFADPVATTNQIAAQLKADGTADVVVALMHEDLSSVNALGPDVDLGFGGHSHNSQTGATATGAATCQPASAGANYSYATLVVNPDGTVESSCENIAVGEDAQESADIAALYETAAAKAEELGAATVGNLVGIANRGTLTGEDTGGNRGVESSAGNLIAEGFYQYSQMVGTPADFGIMNPGGIRADLDPNGDGVITYQESYSVQPFGNTYGTLDITGAQIYTMLEQQWHPDADNSRPILRLGLSENVKYAYDPAAPLGERIVHVTINGTPVDRAATYTVASNTFLLEGSDGFTVLAEGTNLTETGVIDNDAFNAWIQSEGTITADYTQRSFGISGPLEGAAGEEITLELSSLILTSTEPKSTSVEVLINGRTVGTYEIDPSFQFETNSGGSVQGDDETGRATATFEVPSNVRDGANTLTIRAAVGEDVSTITVPFTGTNTAQFIDIVNFSDFHGHLENAVCLDAAINSVKAQNETTLVTSSGDSIGGSAFISSVNKDEATLEFLQLLDLDASAVGNHEFDAGYPDLVERALGQYNIPYLGANVEGADEINDPYVIKDIDGVSVAFIGTVTASTPTAVTPSGIEGLTFHDPVAVTNDIAATLKDGDDSNGEADIVVALFHDGVSEAQGLGANVDVVFAGHTHQVLTGDDLTAGGAPIIQSGQYGQNLARAEILIGEDGELTIVPSVVATASGDDCVFGPTSPAVEELVDEAQAAADERGNEVIGSTSTGLFRGQFQGESGPSENRGTESSLGNYIGDAFLWKANDVGLDADFGMTNSGGIRADLPGEDITYADAFSVMPFGNVLGTKDITEAGIYQMLEEQWNKDPEATRPILRLGLSENIRYTFDDDAPVGSKIQTVWLNGVELDREGDTTYRVATNTFLLEGGDGFDALGAAENFLDTGFVDVNAFIEYIQHDAADGPIVAPTAQRSWDIEVGTIDEDELTGYVDLKSLSYTHTNDIKPATVDIYIGDTLVAGGVEVDSSMPTENRDNAGTAYAEFSFAEIASGDYMLRVVPRDVDGNDLGAFELPVTIENSLIDGPVEPVDPTDPTDPTDEPTPDVPTKPGKPVKPGGDLSHTGAEVGLLIAGFAALLVLGGALVAVSRRNEDAEDAVETTV